MRAIEPQATLAKTAFQPSGATEPATGPRPSRAALSPTVPPLIAVLLLHAAVILTEQVEAPKWLAALEGLIALVTGLYVLRHLEQSEVADSTHGEGDSVEPTKGASRG